MSWKDLLKAELPPKQEEGTPMTNERVRQMNAWAKEYENNLMQSLARVGSTLDSASFKNNSQSREVTINDRKYTHARFANLLKQLLRAVVYGRFGSNYAFEEKVYLQSTDEYIRDMALNSTANIVLSRWLAQN